MLKQLNLFLAIFWLFLGGGLLIADFTTGKVQMPIPLLGNMSAGWFVLVLTVYNLLRWWSQRGPQPSRSGPVNPLRVPRRTDPDDPGNPAFDFRDRPPQPPPSPSVN